MAPSIAEIETAALTLTPEERARLVLRLLDSLESPTDSAEEIEKLWLVEAERRYKEIRTGAVEGIPADKVFAEIRARRS